MAQFYYDNAYIEVRAGTSPYVVRFPASQIANPSTGSPLQVEGLELGKLKQTVKERFLGLGSVEVGAPDEFDPARHSICWEVYTVLKDGTIANETHWERIIDEEDLQLAIGIQSKRETQDPSQIELKYAYFLHNEVSKLTNAKARAEAKARKARSLVAASGGTESETPGALQRPENPSIPFRPSQSNQGIAGRQSRLVGLSGTSPSNQGFSGNQGGIAGPSGTLSSLRGHGQNQDIRPWGTITSGPGSGATQLGSPPTFSDTTPQNYDSAVIKVTDSENPNLSTTMRIRDIADPAKQPLALKMTLWEQKLQETTWYDGDRHGIRWVDSEGDSKRSWKEINDEGDLLQAIEIQFRRSQSNPIQLDFECFLQDIYDNATIIIRARGKPKKKLTASCSAISTRFENYPIWAQDVKLEKLVGLLQCYAKGPGNKEYAPPKRIEYCSSDPDVEPEEWTEIIDQEDFQKAIMVQSNEPAQNKLKIQLEFLLSEPIPDVELEEPDSDSDRPREIQRYTRLSGDTIHRLAEIVVTADRDPTFEWKIRVHNVATANGFAPLTVDDLQFGKLKDELWTVTQWQQSLDFKERLYSKDKDRIWCVNSQMQNTQGEPIVTSWEEITNDSSFRKEVRKQKKFFDNSSSPGGQARLQIRFDFTRASRYSIAGRRGLLKAPTRPSVPTKSITSSDPKEKPPGDRKRKAGQDGSSPPKAKRVKGWDDDDDNEIDESGKKYVEYSREDLEDAGEDIVRGADTEDPDGEKHMDQFDEDALANTWGDCDHFDEDTWNQCCEFFKHKDNKDHEVFEIEGFKGPDGNARVHQHQAYAVWWMLRAGIEYGGGYLGDHMGLGKTRTLLLLACAQVWVNTAIQGVEDDRKNGKFKHLPPSTTRYYQSPEDLVCPSDRFNICCPCVEYGPTFSLRPKHGPQLIMVPPGLIPNWEAEFKKAMSLNSPFSQRVRLWIEHGTGPNKGLSPEQKESLRCTTCKSGGEQHNECVADPAQDGIIVLTSNGTYSERMQKDPFQVVHEFYDPENPDTVIKRTIEVGIPWAVAIVDEAHTQRNPNSKTTAPSLLARARGHPYVWAASGTPIISSPKDIGNWLWVVRRQCALDGVTEEEEEEEEEANYLPKSIDTLEWLDKRHKGSVNNFKNMSQEQAEKPSILKALWDEMAYIAGVLNAIIGKQIIRRIAETKWRGKPIAELPKMDKKDVYLPPIAPDWRFEMDRHVQQARHDMNLAGKTSRDAARRLRMMATIPALADPVFDGLAMTGKEIQDKGWYSDLKASPYYQHLDKIYNSSPKLKFLKQILRKVVEPGKTPVWKQPNEPYRKDQLLITSAFPVISFIVFLWIKRRFHKWELPEGERNLGEQTEIIYNGMGNIKQEIIDAFQNDESPTKGDKEIASENEKKCRILVSTNRVMGVGFTLHRAHRVILMEPDWLTATEEQVFARVHRIGSLNEKTWARRLITSEDEIEQQIIQRQTARNAGSELVFNAYTGPPKRNPNAKKVIQPKSSESSLEKRSPPMLTKAAKDKKGGKKKPDEKANKATAGGPAGKGKGKQKEEEKPKKTTKANTKANTKKDTKAATKAATKTRRQRKPKAQALPNFAYSSKNDRGLASDEV